MRTTDLRRTTIGVVIVITIIVLLLGVIRALVITPQGALAQQGEALFQEVGCARCHDTDNREAGMAPGLQGLFHHDRLPVSGRPATRENVRRQMESPYKSMPSFEDRLDKEEMNLLVDYLQTL